MRVEGYEIKAWTDQQVLDFTTVFKRIHRVLEKVGFTTQKLMKLQPTKRGQYMLQFWQEIFAFIPEVISKTLDIPEDHVFSWPWDKTIAVGIAIIEVNKHRFEDLLKKVESKVNYRGK